MEQLQSYLPNLCAITTAAPRRATFFQRRYVMHACSPTVSLSLLIRLILTSIIAILRGLGCYDMKQTTNNPKERH